LGSSSDWFSRGYIQEKADMLRTLTLLTLCLWLASSVRAEDAPAKELDNWHQWRGPLANGTAPKGDPPVKWDDKTNIKWNTEIPGKGTSTPIIWGDQVFVLTVIDTGKKADPATLPKPDPGFKKNTTAPTTIHQFVVMSLDRKTGKVRWQQTATEQVPHEGHHQTHCYAAGSPTTDGKFLYVSFGSRGIYCYDMDGKQQWERDFGKMNTRLGWGEAITPALHGDTLVVNWDQEKDSFITALDAKTGKTRWKVDRDEKTTWNTPLIVERKDRTQVIVNGKNRVRSYDLATGKEFWQCGGQTVNPIPSPILNGEYVICMSGYQGSAAFAIPLDSNGDVTKSDKLAWHHDRGTPYVPSPLLAGDRLYFTQVNNNVLTCLDVKTGKPIFDGVRLEGLRTLYASPVLAADRIYLPDREGNTLVFKKSDKLEILATNKLGETIDASPAVVGKQLFLRGEKHLFCIEEN
jgi:outer membrane protein assembly factor BamB